MNTIKIITNPYLPKDTIMVHPDVYKEWKKHLAKQGATK